MFVDPVTLAVASSALTVIGPFISAIAKRERWHSRDTAEHETVAEKETTLRKEIIKEATTLRYSTIKSQQSDLPAVEDQLKSKTAETPEANAQAGKKVGLFQGETSTEMPVLSSQPIEPPKKSVKEFTALFGKTTPPEEASPVSTTGPEPSFTSIFKDMGTSQPIFNAPPPVHLEINPAASQPVPSVPPVSAPSQPDPVFTASTSAVTSTPLPMHPQLPSMPVERPAAARPSSLPGHRATGAFLRPAAEPAPVPVEAPAGPSPYTQIISRQSLPAAQGTRQKVEETIQESDRTQLESEFAGVRKRWIRKSEATTIRETKAMEPIRIEAAPSKNPASTMLLCYAAVLVVFGAISAIHYWGAIKERQDLAFTMVGLLLTMVAGMFVQVITCNYRASAPLFHVTASQLAYPLLFSPIVFYPVWALTTGGSQHLFSFYAAFLNGYFWESVVSSAKSVTVETSSGQLGTRRRRRKLPVTPQPA